MIPDDRTGISPKAANIYVSVATLGSQRRVSSVLEPYCFRMNSALVGCDAHCVVPIDALAIF